MIERGYIVSSPFYKVIKGCFTPINYEPDGDSVRFVADNPKLYKNLHGSYRIKLSRNGSVQLRFEAVDAPEIHYGKAAQPFGKEARDQLLAWMGFENIRCYPNEPDRVESCEPEIVRGAILSKAAETNGRPVAYVMLEEDAACLEDGDWVRLDEDLLEKTINYRLLDEGMAYYTVYTSTPFDHREFLSKVASRARGANRGVWELDMTSEFVLEDQDSIGLEGQLILPKLFRRCTDYLKDVRKGCFNGDMADWLIWISSGSRNENDNVVIQDYLELRLSDLIEQRNKKIVFKADLLDIMFVEK
jgi:endonuclease YncB( thermonuclease family)